LEEAGFSTLVLTTLHDFTREVGIPRSAAIEHPFGRSLGAVGDRKGQREVLMAALSALERAQRPGEIIHLPFTWPEEPKKVDWQPPEMSPLIKLYLSDLKEARRREIEETRNEGKRG
jgi:hypothetical protein